MEKLKVIVGLGKTGLSYARHLAARGERFAVADSNPAPDGLDELMQIAPGTTFGDLTAATLESAEQILLSPGVPRAHEAVRSAIERGVPVTGDVDMFGELATRPVVAITGTNGKSTVTAMMGALAAAAGRNAGVGGNIGTPCLDLLDEDVEVYLLEVSSYQLEVATALPCEVAVVLNLAPDHLDRYPSLDDYYATKANIYRKAKIAVLSRDLDYPFEISAGTSVIDFGASEPQDEKSFGMRTVDGERWLCRGSENLIATSELPVRGGHNHLNALAALAIGSALDWEIPAMLEGLRTFPGLVHRCETVGEIDGVTFINDSKSTNVESTIAAVEGLGPDVGSLTLLLGGVGKGADFTRLLPAIERHVDRVIVFGRDRETIAAQLTGVDMMSLETLEEVVSHVLDTARSGDCVLLSPACASQDQFANFEQRGDRFRSLVLGGAS